MRRLILFGTLGVGFGFVLLINEFCEWLTVTTGSYIPAIAIRAAICGLCVVAICDSLYLRGWRR